MIHYHGLPITGADFPIMAMKGKHCMVSYADHRQVAEAAELCQTFTLDNGAWSAYASGMPFDIEGFCDFATVWAHHPRCDWYCMPDVIGGDEHDNAKIRAEWFKMVDSRTWAKGVPIWHMHEPLSVLQSLMNWPQPTIAIGSSGEYATVGTADWWIRMHEAMTVLCDESGVPWKRIHGLRMLDPTVFSHLPLSSADSTNVARNCGIDKAWSGPYAPKTERMRALVMIDRIESHASAPRWSPGTAGVQKNLELLG